MFTIKIGEVIKKIRTKKEISARELARRSGVSQGYLSQLETGKNNNPTNEVLKKIASGLGISYPELMMEADGVLEVDTLFQAFGFWGEDNPSEQTIPITVFLPRYTETYTENGGYLITENSHEELKENLFDLYHLLNLNIDIKYKGKKINSNQKQKILTILGTILE